MSHVRDPMSDTFKVPMVSLEGDRFYIEVDARTALRLLNDLGDAIDVWMHDHGMTQAGLAHRCGAAAPPAVDVLAH